MPDEAVEPSIEDRAGQQQRNGWGPIPLPSARKAPPPDGFTGDAPTPSYADWWTVYSDNPAGWGNLGARIPMGVVGIDVDAYSGKNGAATWRALGGPEFPDTVILSARFTPGYDGVSGIRLYRLPEHLSHLDLWGAHDGIEILRFHHRYAVAPGSLHPEGTVYRLFDTRTKAFLDVLPDVATLPLLPDHLADRLTPAGAPWAGHGAPVGVPRRTPDVMCRQSLRILQNAVNGLSTADSRFDQMRDAVWALVKSEDEGHSLGVALDTLKLAYIAVTAKDRREAKAEPPASEFDRALATARAKVDADPTDPMFHQCCTSDERPEPVQPPASSPLGETVESQEWSEPTPYDRAVQRHYAELRVREDAKTLLARHNAGQSPPLAPLSYPVFAAQPDEQEHYRVEALWPAEGRAMLSAAAKSGKTTLVAANLIPSLLDGRPFLGRYATQPVTGGIILLNMEVGPRTLRRWMRAADVPLDDRLTVLNLRGRAASLPLASDHGRADLSRVLRDLGAEVVILDPLAPLLASLGLDENSNTDVARFFSWWAEALDGAGVADDLIVHHTGHAGQRSRGASRFNDEPDAIWTLTKADETDDEDELDVMLGAGPTRFLAAYGRDVDLPAEGLEYDPQTHALTLNEQAKGSESRRKLERRVMACMSDGTPRSKNGIYQAVKGNRNEVMVAIGRLLACGELVDSGARTGNGYPLLILGTA
jgi:AAA domain/Bifunctional DNA primase/polymerase, N-terminal